MKRSDHDRRRRGNAAKRSDAAPVQPIDSATVVPQVRPSTAKPALAVEVTSAAPPALDDELTATIRRWARPTTPEEMVERGVKRVRSVSMTRMASLIEKAVNKTLIERTLEGGSEEALTLSSSAREEFLRLARTELQPGGSTAENRATSTLDRLRSELTQRRRELSDRRREFSECPDEVIDTDHDGLLEDKLRAIFAVHGSTRDHELEQETMNMVLGEVRGARRVAREAQRRSHTRELNQLERRISKLSVLLGDTEEELRLARGSRVVDQGVESIYDVVQGIDGDDVQLEQKSDLMRCIFEANLALRS